MRILIVLLVFCTSISSLGADLKFQRAKLLEESMSLLRNSRYLDAHVSSLTARTLLGDSSGWEFYFLDAWALWKLEDTPEAKKLLEQALGGTTSGKERLSFLYRWIEETEHQKNNSLQAWGRNQTDINLVNRIEDYQKIKNEDFNNFKSEAGQSSPFKQALLEYEQAPQYSATLSGLMSAVLPGSAHARLGLWQDAFVTFSLNTLFIMSTIKLAEANLWWPAAASGTAASFFYVGGILSAVKLTEARNEQNISPSREKLESILFPELRLEF